MTNDIVPDFIYDIHSEDISAFEVLRRWHRDLATLAQQMHDYEVTHGTLSARSSLAESSLKGIARDATRFLNRLGVTYPGWAFRDEYERAAAKHPGMTLDAGGHTDENRFYALAEEVGEVCAALTYDNAQDTGHNADLISEVTQVGALALAWLVRYQDGGER